MRVLLLEDQKQVREILTFLLESEFSATVSAVDGVQEALGLLLEDAAVDLIVCTDDNKNLKLFKYLSSAQSTIPVIVLRKPGSPTQVGFPDLIFGVVNPDKAADDMKSLVQKAIQSGKVKVGEADTEYVRIHTSLVAQSGLKSDVYIRLSKIKFIKLFSEGAQLNGPELQKYAESKKIDYLYVKREEAALFANKFKEDLEKLLSDPKVTPEDAGQAALSVHETVTSLSNGLGFTPEVQALAKQGIRLTLKNVGNNPQLKKILLTLMDTKGNYISKHSVALAQIACGLAAAIKWPSSSTFEKLTFSAFFHDIVIKNEALAAIPTIDVFAKFKNRFTEDEQKLFVSHPIAAAQLIQKFIEIPPEVDQIILSHHERPDGNGFPRRLTPNKIAPLACLFIIAHELLDFVVANGPKADVAGFLKRYKEANSVGNFKKILDQLDPAAVVVKSG